MPKYTDVFKELGIQQKQVAEACRIDEPTMSKIKSGSILPNKAKLQRICEHTQKEALDFYSRDEINLISVCRKRKPSEKSKLYLQFTVSLLRSKYCTVLSDSEKLKICGFDSQAEWLRSCIRKLDKRYEIITKAVKK